MFSRKKTHKIPIMKTQSVINISILKFYNYTPVYLFIVPQDNRPCSITKRAPNNGRVRRDPHSSRTTGPARALHCEGTQHVHLTLRSHLHARTGCNISKYIEFIFVYLARLGGRMQVKKRFLKPCDFF